MARRQHHNSISLFPFLAVLICAMGSLILLLLVLTRKIRHEQDAERTSAEQSMTVQSAAPDRSAEIADLERQIEVTRQAVILRHSQAADLQQTVAERQQQREDLRAELEQLRGQLQQAGSHRHQHSISAAEKETRELQAREAVLLRQLEDSEKLLLRKQQLLANARTSAEDASLIFHEKNSALISLRAQVENAARKSETTSGCATLLEFSNPAGTTRTPIVFDVSDEGMRLLPGTLLITTADMEGFPIRDNPLMSAILASHRHRSKRSITGEPYVLLLVRPDGCLIFYGAQRILIENGIHYGYELVDPDREIVTGEEDLAESPVVQTAINDALKRRENLYAKLMAIAQQNTGLPGMGDRSELTGTERRLSVRPDGRVVVDEGAGPRPLDGRFYAGGVAPPPSLLRNRPIGGYRRSGSDQLTPTEAEKLADEFAERYARQRSREDAGNAEPAGQTARGMHDDPAGIMVRRGSVAREAVERRYADVLFGSDGTLKTQPLAGRAGGGRTGLAPGDGAVSSFSSDSDAPNGQFANPASRHEQQHPDAEGRSLHPADVPPASASEPAHAAQQNGDFSPSIVSEMAAPDRARNNLLQSGMTPLSPAESLLASAATESPSTGIPDLSRVDQDLLGRLQQQTAIENGQSRQHSGSLAAPVGIVVFLDEHHLTIGQQPALEVNAENLDAVFASLLQGIQTEIDDARRKPNEPVMPIVKFIVSPGGEKWRIPLSHSLKSAGIHSAEILELTPYIVSADTIGRAELGDVASGMDDGVERTGQDAESKP